MQNETSAARSQRNPRLTCINWGKDLFPHTFFYLLPMKYIVLLVLLCALLSTSVALTSRAATDRAASRLSARQAAEGTPCGDGNAVRDACGVCGGDGTSCKDCLGQVFGVARYDECGVCNGDGKSCADCEGTPNGSVRFDSCGVCGGDNTSCIEGGCADNCLNLARCMFSFLFSSSGDRLVGGVGKEPSNCKNC